jgi:translation initiation factor 3 subunit F
MFQVLDHHTRRNDQGGRVVGALLGSVNSDGTVQLKHAFPMNHDDLSSPQVVRDGELLQPFDQFFDIMIKLHKQVNPREVLVGWYTTTKLSDADAKDEVREDDSLLHSFFEDKVGEKMPCVLLRVDCNIRTATKMGISTFVASNLALRQDKEAPPQLLGKCFQRVTCEMRSYEAERIGVDFITHNSIGEGGGEVLGSDLEKLEQSIAKLTQMLEKTIEYVDNVDAGKTQPDTRVGRVLMDAINSVPEVRICVVSI